MQLIYNVKGLFSLFIVFVLFVVSCHHHPKPVVENPLQICIDYATHSDIYEYCVYKNAATLPDIGSVNTYCPQAGSWQDDCKQTWVMEHKDAHPLETLMEICAQNADCAFELLDSKPHNDVLVQVELCIRHADRYRHDCVMHAIQRWYFTWPDAEEVSRVAQKRNPFPEQIGTYIGARVACDGVGTCNGNAENKQLCEKYVVEYEDKRKCPNQHRRRKVIGR